MTPRYDACMSAIAVQVPVAGSYSSAEGCEWSPFTTSTLPSASSTAACWAAGPTIFPVEDQVPLSGSYRSAAP